jgi:hypothetical protein
MLKVLETDFARLPELLGQALAPAPPPVGLVVTAPAAAAQAEQLGLF